MDGSELTSRAETAERLVREAYQFIGQYELARGLMLKARGEVYDRTVFPPQWFEEAEELLLGR